ncbi:hypothetical protein [Baekduia sp. Peel2402]|uniref:hypothetical protein n=1 Tax=Baekduia sp. Peel2402 TaxID=3458296 RepID=UPI00403E4D68
MHGRLRIPTLAAALVTALTVIAPATPAAADETLALGDPATLDGVVTAWTITGANGQTVRLRSAQALGGGGTATTATSDPAPISGSPATVTTARLPIAAGGRLALVGASGSPAVSATVEPDADGDGYGDTSQDSCPADATTHAGACLGTVTVGSPLTLQPDPYGYSASGSPLQAYQLSAAGTVATVPRNGVLVRWRVRVKTGLGDTVLQLLRPATPGGSTFTVAAESAPVHTTSADVVTVAASVPVRAGDRLAARSTAAGGSSDLGALAYLPGDELAGRSPPTTAGETWTPKAGAPAARRLLVQADVEPDADGDGKGDLTQDRADLKLTGQAAGSSTHVYTVRNLGPDAAQDVLVRFAGVIAPNVVPEDYPPVYTCTGIGADRTCRIIKLAAGAEVSFYPYFLIPMTGPFSAILTSTVSIAATTPDPDHANDAPVSLTTSYSRTDAPPPPPPAPGPCANVIRGTRDDDVLRGTAFPDRLVGNDGNDLLKGGAADDCLEGGAGADVLDGGDGNDRLSGSSGRDRLIGGKGDDKLVGGKGNDRLSGGSGNDTLSPGAGHDAIDGGAGNDTINSVDGVRETVICGAGKDTVRADRRDRLRGCEKVTRKK